MRFQISPRINELFYSTHNLHLNRIRPEYTFEYPYTCMHTDIKPHNIKVKVRGCKNIHFGRTWGVNVQNNSLNTDTIFM